MTVAELIEELKKYPAEMEVRFMDSELGEEIPVRTVHFINGSIDKMVLLF